VRFIIKGSETNNARPSKEEDRDFGPKYKEIFGDKPVQKGKWIYVDGKCIPADEYRKPERKGVLIRLKNERLVMGEDGKVHKQVGAEVLLHGRNNGKVSLNTETVGKYRYA
jgi:hypothetical protein